MNFMKGFTKSSKRGSKQNWESLPTRVWITGILSDPSASNLFYKFIFLLSCIQIIFQTLQVYVASIYHYLNAFDNAAFELARLIAVTHYLKLSQMTFSTRILLVITTIYGLLILFLVIFYFTHLVLKRRLPAMISKRFLAFTHFHIMIMALPISSVCFQIIFQVLSDSSLSVGYLADAIVCELVNLLYGFGGCLIYLKIKSADPFSRLNNFYMINTLTQKLALNLLMVTAITRNQTGNYFLIPIVFSLVFEVGTKLSILLGIPFLKFKFNIYALFTSSITITLSILNLLHFMIAKLLFHSWGYTYLLCAFIFFLLVWKIERSYINNYRTNMNLVEFSIPQREYWLIQRILYFKKILYGNIEATPGDNKIAASVLKCIGSLKTVISSGNKSQIKISSRNLIDDEGEIDKTEVAVVLMRMILNSKNHSVYLRLLLSDALLHDQGKINEPCSISYEITTENNSFSFILSGLKIQSDVKKIIRELLNFNINVLDLPYYFRQTEQTNIFRSLIVSQIDLQQKIYYELQQPKFELTNFTKMNTSFFNDWKTIDQIWDRHLEEFSRKSFGLILLYAFHNIFNRHDSSKGLELLNKYKAALSENLSLLKSPKLTPKTIFDPANVSVVISAGKTTTGKIFSISPSVQNVFGHRVENLVEKSINVLMPKIFHSLHNGFILKKCDDEKRIRDIAAITSFAIDIRGYIIPCRIISTIYPLIDEGLMIWGMIRTEKPILDFAIINQENELEAYTQGLAIQLGLDTHQSYRLSALSKELSQAMKFINRATASKSKQYMSISDTPLEMAERKHNNLSIKSLIGEYLESPFLRQDFENEMTPHQLAQELLEEGRTMMINPPQTGFGQQNCAQSAVYTVKCEIKQYETKILRLLIFQKFQEEKKETAIISLKRINDTSQKSKKLQPSSLLLDLSRKPDNLLPPEDFSEQQEYSLNEFENEDDPRANASNLSRIMKPLENSFHQSNHHHSHKDPTANEDNESTFVKADYLPFFKTKTNVEKDKTSSREEDKRNSLTKNAKPIQSFFYNSSKSLFGANKFTQNHIQYNHNDYIASLGIISIEKIKAKITNTTDMQESQDYGYLDYAKTNSVSEYKSQYITLQKLQENFKLFRFYQGNIVGGILGIMTIYILLFLISVIMIYVQAINGVPNVKNTTQFTHSLIKAIDNYFMIMRAQFSIETDLQIFHGSLGEILSWSKLDMRTGVNGLIENNHEIFETIQNAGPLVESRMFQQDIKIFYDNFEQFTTAKTYNIYNYFEAMKLATSQAIIYSTHADQDFTPVFVASDKFLDVNLVNDLLEKTSSLLSLVYTRVDSQVSDLQQTSTYILVSYGVITTILTSIAVLFFYKLATQNISFSQCLFGQSYEDELVTQSKNLKTFLDCIQQESFNDLLNQNKGFSSRRSEPTVKLTHIQRGNTLNRVKVLTGSMIFEFFKIFNQMSVMVFLGMGIIIAVGVLFIKNVNQLKGIYNDMIKAGEIDAQVQLAFTEGAFLALNPNLIIKNRNGLDMMENDLLLLEERITNKYTGFTLDFMQLLNEDYCQYKIMEFDCEGTLNGIAKQGIFSTIYLVRNILTTQLAAFRKYTFGTPEYFQNVFSQEIIDLFPIIFYAIRPALNYHIEDRANDLVNIADQEANKIITYVIICIVIAIVTISLSWLYFYTRMIKNRRGLAKSMLILPLRVVLKNRAFKEFLLKDSKEFYQSISRHEESGGIEDTQTSGKKKNRRRKKQLFTNSEN